MNRTIRHAVAGLYFISCAAAASLDLQRSSKTGPSHDIIFCNPLAESVQVFWIDANGVRQPASTVESGCQLRLKSNEGHVWFVTKPDGAVVDSFEVSDKKMLSGWYAAIADRTIPFVTDLNVEPSSVTANLELGDAVAKKGEMARAILYFSRAVNISPDNLTVRDRLFGATMRRGQLRATVLADAGFEKVEEGDLAGAISLADKALTIYAHSGMACLVKAVANLRKQDWDASNFPALQAVHLLKSEADANERWGDGRDFRPAQAAAHKYQGLVLEKRGLAGALQQYRLALGFVPSDAEAKEAVTRLEAIATEATAIALKGDIQRDAGRLDDAVAIYKRALEKDRGNTMANLRLASVLLQNEMPGYSDVYSNISTVQELEPDNATAHKYRGMLEEKNAAEEPVQEEKNELLKKAIKAYQKAVELDPADQEAKVKLFAAQLRLKAFTDDPIATLKYEAPSGAHVEAKVEMVYETNDLPTSYLLWYHNNSIESRSNFFPAMDAPVNVTVTLKPGSSAGGGASRPHLFKLEISEDGERYSSISFSSMIVPTVIEDINFGSTNVFRPKLPIEWRKMHEGTVEKTLVFKASVDGVAAEPQKAKLRFLGTTEVPIGRRTIYSALYYVSAEGAYGNGDDVALLIINEGVSMQWKPRAVDDLWDSDGNLRPSGIYRHASDVVEETIMCTWGEVTRKGISYHDISEDSMHTRYRASGTEKKELQFDGYMTQRIRPPSEAAESKRANCIEGSVLFAGLFRRFGLHTRLCFPPGHAFVGVALDASAKTWVYLETTHIGQQGLPEGFALDATNLRRVREGFLRAKKSGQEQFDKLTAEGVKPNGDNTVLDVDACFEGELPQNPRDERAEERKIAANLRKLFIAAYAYGKQHGKDRVRAAEIVSSRVLNYQLRPLAGENYGSLTVSLNSPLSVKTKDGRVIEMASVDLPLN